MRGLIRGQRGSAVAVAIAVSLFLALVLAGLMPMLTQELSAGKLDRDVMETRYVAEAGVKHALAVFKTSGGTWGWLGQPQRFNNDANKTYTVTISPPFTGTTPAGGTTYTIVSRGQITNPPLAGGPTWTARGTFTTAASGMVDDETRKYGILSTGTLTVYSGTYTNAVNGQPYALASVADKPGFAWFTGELTTGVTGVNLDILPASFFSITNPIYSGYTAKTLDKTVNPQLGNGSSWSNLNGTVTFPAGSSLYEVAGDVAINTTTGLATGSGKYVAIYSHGNIIVNDNLDGNFIFMADGTITVNARSHKGTIKLYSKGNMTINAPISGYSVLMTRGVLKVNANSFVKSFMFGRTSVTLNVPGPITGAVYSNGTMDINSATIFNYDPSVIP
jgi:hypothetical protein